MVDSEAHTILPDDPSSSISAETISPASFVNAQPRPSAIGRYRIIVLLGEGGMGAVYEAEQDQPRRRVALKVIKATWASPELLRRFAQESQVLGRLHHPGIAQIYEAGSADTGYGVQPFFAMELIHGKPLVGYADARELSTRQRLALMLQVCDAVQHAHQRGIIHRDLKPGNILVDESGQAKILDFGLARATDSDAQATRQTDIGQLLGTLAYMSPEQVLADPLALDTRSDVYALGVILYELLAGKMPYTLSRHLHEAVQTIQEVDPQPLSSVNRHFRGDIETIVAKALEKDKNRRYASAADLAGDIRRYLEDRPILAKPASAGYQLRKFARRNKALVAGINAVFIVLVLGIVVSTGEAVRARRAEATAKQQSEIAQAVNDFLQKDLLAQASAYNQAKADPDLKVRTALDRAAEKIQGKFDKQPAVEAAIRSTVGNTYMDLGLFAEARKQLDQALELQRRTLGPENPKTIETMLNLEKVEEAQGQFPEAEKLGAQVLEISRRALGPEDPGTLGAMNRLSSVYDNEGKLAQAEALAAQSVEISRRVLGPEAVGTLRAMHFLAIVQYEEGKYAEAEALNSQTMELQRRVLGPEHPDTLASMNNLGAVFADERKYTEARALTGQLVELRRRVLGPEHPDTLQSMSNLALDYSAEGNLTEAEKIDKQVLETQRRVLGPEHPDTLRSMHNLANDYRAMGNKTEAETIDRQLLDIRRRVLGPESVDTLWSMNNLAVDYRGEGKYTEAEALDTRTLDLRRRTLGPENPHTISSMTSLGLDYMGEGKYQQAETLYRKSLQESPANRQILSDLAWLLLTAQDHRIRRPKEGLDLSRRAVQGAPDNPARLETLGLAEIRNGLWDEAIASLNKAEEIYKKPDAENFFFLALAHQGRGEKAEAGRDFERGVELARKDAAGDSDLRMFWAEAAEALGKPGPVPTLLEVQTDPDRAMERLKRAAAAGFLKAQTLQTSTDLAPLRSRPDFQALLERVRSRLRAMAKLPAD